MARIRSIHPGVFTDEAFMALSAHARLLLLGVWTEADDDGVFDYKPLTLKARLFPADNVDVEALLLELERINWIERFENGPRGGYGTRYYAACKNLRRYQRPKKPNTRNLLPDHLRTYVGLSDPSSPPVPHQFPTGTEQPQQMEEGGGKMEEVEERVEAPQASPAPKAVAAEIDLTLPSNLDRSRHPRGARPSPVEVEISPDLRAKLARGTRLPADWVASPKLEFWAEEQAVAAGLAGEKTSAAWREREISRFKDHYAAKTGQAGTALDWDASFRNWIRKAIDYAPKRSSQNQAGNGFATLAANRFSGAGSA